MRGAIRPPKFRKNREQTGVDATFFAQLGMDVAPIVFASRLEPEDQARADYYALLSRLYQDAPDTALLGAIAESSEMPEDGLNAAGVELARAWRELVAASAAMDASSAAAEYQDLFIGVGKSEVSLYASAYNKHGTANPLVEVRAALAALGLARQDGSNTYEDHLGAVCETMRMLIAGTRGSDAYPFAEQREFFSSHVQSWVFDCCAAIHNSPIANYYRQVAKFTRFFMAVERDSFAME
jgi:TorA maturation chaperone TorD